ncbi:MAG: CPBP family intramembrane metalloprotease [Firmicutes bacterium]|nr:CPBP family intramembrane metalloprotease [Bacillota bacterium]
MKKKQAWIVIMVVLACFCMGYVDAVLRPGYVVKSALKLVLFLGLPFIYSKLDTDFSIRSLFHADKRGFLTALALGAAVYELILGAYFVFRNIFDFSALTTALTAQTGVARNNFLWVSLYISFINSLLEEFFFRGFAFLNLKALSGRAFAYGFSAFAFAAYHIAMMIGWFEPAVTALALTGLFAGGLIFDRFDEPGGSIWLSWLVHMFANFAINTVGFILFAA